MNNYENKKILQKGDKINTCPFWKLVMGVQLTLKLYIQIMKQLPPNPTPITQKNAKKGRQITHATNFNEVFQMKSKQTVDCRDYHIYALNTECTVYPFIFMML